MDPQSCQLLCKNSETGKAFFKGNFRGEISITKILVLSDDDQRGIENGPSKSYKDLIKEAYFLRRLNVSPHPNILRVFAFDTCTKPYHIITEYADKGTLLQYLQDARVLAVHGNQQI
ncbi:uncharacterized protein LOC110252913 isoform X2 [Exaiptasia diaphana]|uniref:Protein kinase domain-containing protein n=1 Tax=Exaiptasia diaphana TaxID=2652724 RepID=A0A913Y781_EXADI|nr:uncharacterized protein LOC110252913 isoform X2 [Exaiptasia diaphana]